MPRPSGRPSSTSATARGISLAGEVIDLGVEAGLLEKSGSWISYKDSRIGQGRDAAAALVEHPEILQELRQALLEKHEWRSRSCRGSVVLIPEHSFSITKGDAGHSRPAEKPVARRNAAAAA